MKRKLGYMIICLCCLSCGEYEVLEYNKKMRKKVDSLYRVNRDSLVTLSDSLCNELYPKFVSEATDSLKKIRIEEVEKLIKH